MKRYKWEQDQIAHMKVIIANTIFEPNKDTSGLFPAILGKGPWPKLGKNEI